MLKVVAAIVTNMSAMFLLNNVSAEQCVACRSWREFPHPDEEDVEQAENREHARYIKRYNTKLRERAKKEEKARLKEFVEAAFKRDPRVIAHKEAEKAKRCAGGAYMALPILFSALPIFLSGVDRCISGLQ